MINQEYLDTYRKKFEKIQQKIPVKLKDWDEIVYQDYPELVANLLYSLQEFVDYQNIQVESNFFIGSKD